MKLATHNGRGLEYLVESSHNDVRLTKIPTASRRFRDQTGKLVTVQVPSPIDFMGIYIPTKRAIVFDCKTSENPNRLSTGVDHFSENQRQQILMYGEAGAISGILGLCDSRSEYFWCDWTLLKVRRTSIPWNDMLHIGSAKFAIRWQRFCGSGTPSREGT